MSIDSLLFWMRSRRIFPILRSIKKPFSIVDLGCGYHGTFLRKMVQTFPLINFATGVDVSVEKKSSPPPLNFLESDLNGPLPLGDDSQDVATSLAVLEHLTQPRLALEEIFRILKRGGVLFLTTPSPLSKPILEFLAYWVGVIDEQEIRDHKHYFSRKELKELLEDVGFSDLVVKPFQFGLNTFVIAKK